MKYNDFILKWFYSIGVSYSYAIILKDLIFILFLFLLIYISNYITKKIIKNVVKKIIEKTSNKWDDKFLERKVFQRLSHIIPIIIIYLYPQFVFEKGYYMIGILNKVAGIYIVGVVIFVVSAILDALHDIYLTLDISKYKSIKGYIQIAKIVLYSLGVIFIIAILLNKSPLYFLTGLGAMTAVIMFVFKDAILGLVAGIQLSTNDMIRPGDWISIPNRNVDGNVVEISLTSIKVKNFDNSITNIPSYNLVSEIFFNWRGMSESGQRQIKCQIYIDVESVKVIDEQYIINIEKLINEELKISYKVSGENNSYITNILAYVDFIRNYLETNEFIDKSRAVIVKILSPADKGIPIDIYCFTNKISAVEYGDIQSSINNFILATIRFFDIKIFQIKLNN